jgi:hypothetical protein
MPDPWDEDFISAEEYDDPGRSSRLEACDADARRAGFESGYGHGYHHGSCQEGECDGGDRYEGYESGYRAGYDAADFDAQDEIEEGPPSDGEDYDAWFESHYDQSEWGDSGAWWLRAEHAMHRISGLLVTWPLTS